MPPLDLAACIWVSLSDDEDAARTVLAVGALALGVTERSQDEEQ